MQPQKDDHISRDVCRECSTPPKLGPRRTRSNCQLERRHMERRRGNICVTLSGRDAYAELEISRKITNNKGFSDLFGSRVGAKCEDNHGDYFQPSESKTSYAQELASTFAAKRMLC